jgi:hypothetical protein
MGLDLHALSKKDSFKEEELQKLIQQDIELDKKWEIHTAFVEQVCQKQYGMSISEFFEKYEGTENDAEIDKLSALEEVVENKQQLGIAERDPEHDEEMSPTNSAVLNYYFHNCYTHYWGDERLKLDKSILKNEKDHEWIPYGPHHSSEDEGSLINLMDKYSIMPPQNVPEAIKRIKNRRSIDEKDLKLIAFLEKYSDHFFAFI